MPASNGGNKIFSLEKEKHKLFFCVGGGRHLVGAADGRYSLQHFSVFGAEGKMVASAS